MIYEKPGLTLNLICDTLLSFTPIDLHSVQEIQLKTTKLI